MPTFEIEFEVYCERCGVKLTRESTTDYDHRYGYKVVVEPCSVCLESEHKEGYDEGYDIGGEDAEPS